MALSPSLQQFKSSGVYRLEFDKSQIINIPSETIRLIIGFSKKGPFNTPVFVQDSVFFRTVFGDIDTALERKGSFFHRTALTCLDRGPVIVLNLLNLENVDTSQFKSISTSAYQDNSPTVTSPVSSFFNQDKFWFTDPNALVDYANNGTSQSVTNQRLLNVANVGRKTISVIARKSTALGFDILAKEWFSVGQVPEYMNENDYIIDYMIDLIVIEGDFSNYTSLSIDPVFGTYFDTTGLKKTYIDEYGFERDGLNAFLNLDTVNVLGVYTGALLPEFQDKNGDNLYIEDLVNLETSKTGLLLGFDNEKLDDDPEDISGDLIDLVGHTLESEAPTTIDFLSYYGPIIDSLVYPGMTGINSSIIIAATAGQTGANALLVASDNLQGGSATNGWNANLGHYDTLLIYGPSAAAPSLFSSAFATPAAFATFRSEIDLGQTFFNVGQTGGTTYATYAKMIAESYDSSTDTLTVKVSLTADTGVTGPTDSNYAYYYLAGGPGVTGGGTASLNYFKDLDANFSDGTKLYSFVHNDLYQDELSGLITDGDRITIGGTAFAYAEFTRFSQTDFTTATAIGQTANTAGAFGTIQPRFASNINYLYVKAYTNDDLVTGPTAITSQTNYTVNTFTGSINESFIVDQTLTPSDPTTTVWLNNTATGPFGAGGYRGKIVKGDYLVMNFGGTGAADPISPITGKSRLTKVISVQEIVDPLNTYYGYIKVVTNEPVYLRNNGITLELERYKSIDNFVEHYHIHKLSGYTLRAAQMPDGTLTRQNEILDVMYDTNIASALEDREVITFRYIVDSFEGGIEPASKIRLTRLAKAQQSSLAICNMPSVKDFRDSTNPLFKYDSTSSFDATYIATGGNLALNPSNIFTLPGIADGANYAAFYGPNLVIRENGSNKSVPPAAHISNLYIDKYNLALPYSIVAGPRRGVVTGQGLVGVEYAFDRTDLDAIEPFGYNAILNKRGFGLVINANQTAQQNVKSALSQIHVRELLIYIQDGIEAILKNYRWEFNTAQNRLEIKTLADNFLTQILSDGGVYDFQNIMDTTNNTPEIIDSNIGILDTYIEPVRGMGILVHRTTILKTGAIATGNFM
jgi:hypothetical protein